MLLMHKKDKDIRDKNWTLDQLNSWLSQQPEAPPFSVIWQQIKNIAITIFDNAKHIIYNGLDAFSSTKKNCFNLFGFDILIDKSFKCWLLEINSTPDLSGSSSNYRKIYDTDFNIKAHLFAELLNIVFYPELPHAMQLEILGNFECIFPTSSQV